MKKLMKSLLVGLSIPVLLLAACGTQQEDGELENELDKNNESVSAEVFLPHEGVNQEPVPLEVERDGTDVYVKMTAQITDIELDKDYIYKAWTFNGEAPGPVVVVNEGDTIHFTLDNMDPAVPHSMDFHAVHTAPDKGFADIMPNEEGTFVYQASSPGVFMYHCGTDPVLAHVANGMHGVIIVKPTDGYPTDHLVDKEFVIIQNEWYDYNSMEDMIEGEPNQVVFSAKALEEGQVNTNGTVGALIDNPLEAKVGDRIRFFINNVGPNEMSSFHVIGSIMEDVYIDGHPYNHQKGIQTIGLPASGGAVVEFVVKEAGTYTFVTHQFEHVEKGAAGRIVVTE